jgi:hypothetical protein
MIRPPHVDTSVSSPSRTPRSATHPHHLRPEYALPMPYYAGHRNLMKV